MLSSVAHAAPGDAVILAADDPNMAYPSQLAVVEDTLYIMRERVGLYAYRLGDAEPVQLMDFTKTDFTGEPITEGQIMIDMYSWDDESARIPRLQYLFAGDGALYGLTAQYDAIYIFNTEKSVFERGAALDSEGMSDPYNKGNSMWARKVAVAGGKLYMLVDNYNTYVPEIKEFDLETGAKRDIMVEQISAFEPYKPGQLLVGMDEYNYRIQEIGVLDLATGKVEKKLNIKGDWRNMAYDLGADALYIWRAGEVRRSVGFGEFETVAYITSIDDYAKAALLPGGYMAFDANNSSQIAIRNLDSAYMPAGTVKFMGASVYDDFMRALIQKHPELPITFADQNAMYEEYGKSRSTQEEIIAAALTVDAGAFDILSLYMPYTDVAMLYDKGYLGDFGSNPAIEAAFEGMAPAVRDVFTRNGKIIAVPIQYSVNIPLSYSPKAFAAAGLTEDDVPRTYEAYIDFLVRWTRDYADEYPDLQLYSNNMGDYLKQDLAGKILAAQIALCAYNGEPLTFDTPAVRALFQKLDTTDFKSIETSRMDWENYDRQEAMNMKELFRDYGELQVTGYYFDEDYLPLLLSLDADTPGLAQATVGVLCVTPNAADSPLVAEVMKYIMEDMPPALRINLYPGENEPIRNPNYEYEVARAQKDFEQMRYVAENAEGAARTAAQENMKWYEEYMGNIAKWYEWSVPDAAIARYRQYQDQIVVVPAASYSFYYTDDINTLMSRFYDGQLKGEPFIVELSQKVRMMMLENQ